MRDIDNVFIKSKMRNLEINFRYLFREAFEKAHIFLAIRLSKNQLEENKPNASIVGSYFLGLILLPVLFKIWPCGGRV